MNDRQTSGIGNLHTEDSNSELQLRINLELSHAHIRDEESCDSRRAIPCKSANSLFGLINSLFGANHDGLKLLQRGRRTAVPRHQTLRAALTWSFELLSHDEQTILARLSVFRSPFDMEAAVAVVANGTISRANVIDGIADLTAKSLVAADVSGPTTCFYLLETTRTYAAQKLIEPAPAAQRHAEQFAAFFERAEADLETRTMPVLRTAGALMTYGLHWIGLFPRKAMGRSAWH